MLENKLGIVDPALMREVEADVVSMRMAELLSEPTECTVSFEALKAVHRRLFGDLYAMAGQVRTVDLAKGDSAFCYARYIGTEQQRIFAEAALRMAEPAPSPERFSEALAWLASELNALHPFREGNGRAIRTFLIRLARAKGYALDYSLVTPERRMAADIEAFHGRLEPLIDLYRAMLCAGR